MSGIFSGTMMAGLLAAAAVVAIGHEPEASPAEASGALSAEQVFRLQVGGDAGNCVVERGVLDMRGNANLTFNSACEDHYPRLAGARLWSEDADGTVAFTQENGAVVIEFSVSDGVAYQTFQPGAPLASLIALN